MVLVVPVVLQLGVVNQVEERHASNGDLEKWCNASTLGEHILVLPTPPGTAHSASKGIWSLVAATKPGAQLAQFHLAEGYISCENDVQKLCKVPELGKCRRIVRRKIT